MAQHMDQRIDFFSRLAATERSTEIPESADVYGWLCGSWDLHVLHYRGIDVAERGLTGEVHAARVLEGRAIQDVWIMPKSSDRSPNASDDEHVWHDAAFLGRVGAGVAHRVDESGERASRGTARSLERQRHPSGRLERRRNEDSLDLHRDHGGLVSLARRSAVSQRGDVDARSRIPREA
jgi:hypothetical protein